jgi:hypothetical protein
MSPREEGGRTAATIGLIVLIGALLLMAVA